MFIYNPTEDNTIKAGAGGFVLVREEKVLRLEDPADVAAALRTHAHAPNKHGEPGSLAAPGAHTNAT